MRLLHRRIDDATQGGSVDLLPESIEDMWHVYNLLEVGDKVTASALRKVVRETNTGSTSADRVRVRLTVQVTDTNFDAETGTLRASGRNTRENELVKMGAFHTLDLEPGRSFEVEKGRWDAMHLRTLHEATHPEVSADAAAVVMDVGEAVICSIGASMTSVRAHVAVSVPKKRAGNTKFESSLNRFFDAVLAAMLRHLDFAVVKVVILASPGFVKDEFWAYAQSEAGKRGLKPLMDNRDRFVLAHCSAANKRALADVLADPTVASHLMDTKAMGEVKLLQRFYELLSTAPDRAAYGWRHVRVAVDRAAVESLLLSDALFRAHDTEARKAYVALAEEARASGAQVHVLSSMHVTGEQLSQLGGSAAVLRFGIADLDEAAHSIAKLPGSGGSGAGATAAAAAGPAAARGGAGGGAGGDGAEGTGGAGGGHASGATGDAGTAELLAYDSDDSSDSDASYKKR